MQEKQGGKFFCLIKIYILFKNSLWDKEIENSHFFSQIIKMQSFILFTQLI